MTQLIKFLIIALLGFIFCTACQEQVVDASLNQELSSQKTLSIAELQGTWKLNSTLLGDALELPCYEARGTKDSLSKDITLVITQDAAEPSTQKIILNGQAPINLYFASAEILSYSSSIQTGTLKVSALGSTKMAGSYELLACESRIYNFIETAKDFRIIVDKKGQKTLYWGVINKGNSSLMYAGNYLIFEKIK
ncbi:hypothetical protein VB796_05270 [Arcicella sp. LKC2W]|uniref:hypothetical protein n=1 Tax=Arcicella sp. LKC2W TaxID=2984198 RepID=UPI002B207CB3|nr:hypothetical protein [Arcicella sp. LKC2W]MEA5458436.1 hypothetical protein [Arcicella sp. LKC2W]